MHQTAPRVHNSCWQLPKDCYQTHPPIPLEQIEFKWYNSKLAELEHWPPACDAAWLKTLKLQQPHPNYPPIITPYAGHQYSEFIANLGDGRAHLIAMLNGKTGLKTVQAKGSGKTPFSYYGDGRLSLTAAIKEYTLAEQLAQLGIPTTRALALFTSQSTAKRKHLEPAALLIRTAPSFIRFGHFEYYYHSNQHHMLKELADHVINTYCLDLKTETNAKRYLKWFEKIVTATAVTIAHWQAHGFCHGLMNTDNMSIHGLTIDHGTGNFMVAYNTDFNSNPSDYSHRYNFKHQPSIAEWNLHQLAISLSPLAPLSELKAINSNFNVIFNQQFNKLMTKKLGIKNTKAATKLVKPLLHLMSINAVNYHQFWQDLAEDSTNIATTSHHFTHQRAKYYTWWHEYQNFKSEYI